MMTIFQKKKTQILIFKLIEIHMLIFTIQMPLVRPFIKDKGNKRENNNGIE